MFSNTFGEMSLDSKLNFLNTVVFLLRALPEISESFTK